MNFTSTKLPSLQRGLTLVEMMVAMVVGLILMAGVLEIYLSSKQSDRVLTAEARMQENGRFAIHFLADDIRMAGYTGCNTITNITPNVIAKNPPADMYSNADMVVGYDDPQTGAATWPTDLPAAAAPSNIVPGTSVLALQFGASDGANVTGNVVPENANVQVVGGPGHWAKNEDVLITNCSHADLFCISDITQTKSGVETLAYGVGCNTTPSLSYSYGPDAQVMTYEGNMYYIGYNRDDPDPANAKGRPALYRLDARGNSQALVDNVQDMSIRYGVDTDADGSANQYLTAAEVTTANEWEQVVSVRVNLLMASNDDHLAPSPETLPFAGGTYTATDHRLYWAFGDTVVLRNRTQ